MRTRMDVKRLEELAKLGDRKALKELNRLQIRSIGNLSPSEIWPFWIHTGRAKKIYDDAFNGDQDALDILQSVAKDFGIPDNVNVEIDPELPFQFQYWYSGMGSTLYAIMSYPHNVNEEQAESALGELEDSLRQHRALPGFHETRDEEIDELVQMIDTVRDNLEDARREKYRPLLDKKWVERNQTRLKKASRVVKQWLNRTQ